MSDVIRRYLEELERLSLAIKNLDSPVCIVSSDDADGLASAYLFTVILDSVGRDYRIVVLDKVYPEIVERLSEQYPSIVFLDLGGPFFKYIEEDMYNSIVIIDHHMEAATPPKDIIYVNPLKLGFKDESVPSTSVTIYFLMRSLVEKYYQYSWAALLGMGEIPGEPGELAWRALIEGVKTGVIRRVRKSYRVKIHGYEREFKSLYRELTLVSTMGYYDDMGLEIIGWMRYGGMESLRDYVERFKEARKDMYDKMFRRFESGEMVFEKEFIQWFEDFDNLFYNVSPRVFDTFASTISMYGRYFDPRKYILGLGVRNPYIPGYGYLSQDWMVVPIRVTRKLEFRIGIGLSQPVYVLAEAAAFASGGLGYGYKTLGSAVVPLNKRDHFLNIFDSLASGR